MLCIFALLFASIREDLDIDVEALAVFLVVAIGGILAFILYLTVRHDKIDGDVAEDKAGDSGAGKSNLAMAAVEQGFELLSEDLAFIAGGQDKPDGIFADCRELHLLGDSARRFESLRSKTVEVSHNGKPKFIVPLKAGLGGLNLAKTENLSIVFINPNYCEARSIINENNPLEQFVELARPVEPGFKLTSVVRESHINWLSQHSSYQIAMGHDSEHFFALLRTLA